MTSTEKHDSAFGAGSRNKKPSNDDWGDELDDNDRSRASGGAGLRQPGNPGVGGGRDSALNTRDDGRSSMGSNYAGFGLLGKAKRKDDEDDLDNILGSLE